MQVDEQSCRARLQAARVAYLGTVRPGGEPHLVPVTFALDGDTLVTAIDRKPKRAGALQRLRNIAANPAVTVLTDHYDEDWHRLWWVRADGVATVVDAGPVSEQALRWLLEKYPQYRPAPPSGPVVVVRITSWTGWAFGD